MATKVQGLDRLRRKLKALPDSARKEIAKAMEQSAQEIVDLAKSLVPVATGALRDSIGWTWGDAPKGSMTLGYVRSGGAGSGKMVVTIYAGDDQAYWARWVEFGTAPHGLARGADRSRNKRQTMGATHGGTPAQPYFYPAYRAVRKRAKSRVTRAITKSAKRVAAGG